MSHKPVRRDFDMFVVGNHLDLSDTLSFTHGDLDTPGAVLRITVCNFATGEILGALSTLSGEGIEKLSATQFSALFLPEVTELWPPDAILKYDTQLSFGDTDEAFTQWYGFIATKHAITLARSFGNALSLDALALTLDGQFLTV